MRSEEDPLDKEARLRDRAERLGFVINKHFGRMSQGGGYQVMCRDQPHLVFTPGFDLNLDDVEAVLEGAEAVAAQRRRTRAKAR